MENIYDKTIKEIIEPALRPLINILLGIRVEDMQEVKDKIQVTIEREGDHLKALIFKDKKQNALLCLTCNNYSSKYPIKWRSLMI